MFDKMMKNPLLGHKIGLIVGSILGFILSLLISSKADEVVYIEDVVEETSNETTTKS